MRYRFIKLLIKFDYSYRGATLSSTNLDEQHQCKNRGPTFKHKTALILILFFKRPEIYNYDAFALILSKKTSDFL